jgi:putative Ca2+/H+ antiporter (TMEM165/GDT1 family)
MVHLGRLDLIGALRANPVAVIGGVAVITAPVIATIRGRRDHGRFSARTRTLLTGAVIVAVAFSEIWQLIRFGVV